MKNIAFDLPKKYPPIEPPDFASGEVFSFAVTFSFGYVNVLCFNGSRYEAKPTQRCASILNSRRKMNALI